MSALKILGGKWKGRPLKTASSSTRPSLGIVRGALFNICQQDIEGALFLDLFAGSGAMGLEALSRGAKLAVFVEKDRVAIRSIRENIRSLQAEGETQLFAMDAILALKKLAGPFHIITIDPPYEIATAIATEAIRIIEERALLAPHGYLFLEESSNDEEFALYSSALKKKSSRKFGIARLIQFEN